MYATTVKAAYSQSPHPLPSPISNREPLRLEIRVTHTKQRPHPDSNRENNALFSNHNPLTDPPTPPISNQEPFRLEIRATHTKQTPDHDSNRENNALFSNHDRPAKILKSLSAHPLFLFRVESRPTLYFLPLTTNSNCTHVSGRPPSSASPSSTGTPACAGFHNDAAPYPNQKTRTTHPPILWRLKSNPILCFPHLTSKSNLTMLRLLITPKRIKIESSRSQHSPAPLLNSRKGAHHVDLSLDAA